MSSRICFLGTEGFVEEARVCFERVSAPIAPAHWEAEVTNVIWMAIRAGILPPDEGPVRIGLSRRLGIESVSTATLCQGALLRAVASGLPAYDTLFVELAVRSACPLLTFDKAGPEGLSGDCDSSQAIVGAVGRQPNGWRVSRGGRNARMLLQELVYRRCPSHPEKDDLRHRGRRSAGEPSRKADTTVQRLLEIPGIGLLTATALVGSVGRIHAFRRAPQFASWLGLTPREHSSGPPRRPGAITKRGDVYLRCLLTHGARAVLLTAQPQAAARRPLTGLQPWAVQLAPGRATTRQRSPSPINSRASSGRCGHVTPPTPARQRRRSDTDALMSHQGAAQRANTRSLPDRSDRLSTDTCGMPIRTRDEAH